MKIFSNKFIIFICGLFIFNCNLQLIFPFGGYGCPPVDLCKNLSNEDRALFMAVKKWKNR